MLDQGNALRQELHNYVLTQYVEEDEHRAKHSGVSTEGRATKSSSFRQQSDNFASKSLTNRTVQGLTEPYPCTLRHRFSSNMPCKRTLSNLTLPRLGREKGDSTFSLLLQDAPHLLGLSQQQKVS